MKIAIAWFDTTGLTDVTSIAMLPDVSFVTLIVAMSVPTFPSPVGSEYD
jgi:hypothetical protein